MEQLETAVMFRSWYEFARELPPEQQVTFYTNFFAYAMDGIEPDWGNDALLKGFWIGAKPNIDNSIKSRKNGAKGGRPSKKITEDKNPETPPFKPLKTPLKTYQDSFEVEVEVDKEVEENKKEKNKKENSTFQKPSIEEVQDHINAKNYSFDAESFWNFYESKGWKVGSNPMKSWQAACVTWQKRAENHTTSPPRTEMFGIDEDAVGWLS